MLIMCWPKIDDYIHVNASFDSNLRGLDVSVCVSRCDCLLSKGSIFFSFDLQESRKFPNRSYLWEQSYSIIILPKNFVKMLLWLPMLLLLQEPMTVLLVFNCCILYFYHMVRYE